MSHQLLPKEEWTKPDEVRTSSEGTGCWLTSLQDVPYLSHIIKDIEAEMAEREDLEAMVITKRQKKASAPTGH